MDYQSILARFTYDNEIDIMDRISQADKSDYRQNRDIINEIVLWKMNRRLLDISAGKVPGDSLCQD